MMTCLLREKTPFFVRLPACNAVVAKCRAYGSGFSLRPGINNCGTTLSDELERIVETICDRLYDLYVKAGAKSFGLVDLLPAAEPGSAEYIKGRVKTWTTTPPISMRWRHC